jgi:hypothetical protein
MLGAKLGVARRLALNVLFPDKLIVVSEESKKLMWLYAPGFKKRIKKL